jgi:predicted ATP-binding protein involved in virulence
MIKNFEVRNLNSFTSFSNNFNSDVNVITGINGAGKTSVLRLVWYLISANIERVFDDCRFDNLCIETSWFKLSIKPEMDKKGITKVKVDYSDTAKINFQKELPFDKYRGGIEAVNQYSVKAKGACPSVMFPTFRRIEGGFTYLNQKQPKYNIIEDRELKDPIEYGLQNLSRRLGVFDHKFVASISTFDIKHLLTQCYAEVSSQTNKLHAKMARDISSLVSDYHSKKKKKEGFYIKKISEMVDEISEAQKNKLAPFTIVQSIIQEFFQSKSIKISDAIVFGSSGTVLDSDVLSAGEKQFLGFLAYNALMNNGIIFIDEPELSLHIDWQRKLVEALRVQNPSNQLILATHSPFIYSKYEDKELPFTVSR